MSSTINTPQKADIRAPKKVTFYNEFQDDRATRIWSVVDDHKPVSEVFALKYSGFILAVPTLASSIKAQKYFNRCFKISGHNMMMFFPLLIPTMGTYLLHKKMIEQDVLMENIQCVGCTEFKSASMHLISGVIWSFCMSSVASTMVASLKKTIYIPPIDKYPLDTLRLLGKQFYRFIPSAIALCLGNFAYALVLTKIEIDQFKNMKNRMLVRLHSIEVEVTPESFDEPSS